MSTDNCTLSCSSYEEIYELEAPFVYNTYIFTATASLLVSYFVVFFQFRYGPLYPHGILTNIGFTLGTRAFLYMINGFAYLIK